MRLLISLCLVSLTAASSLASAANYTLWVNGRGGGGTVGNYASFGAWGPATTAAGVNKKAVNWDGRSSISSQNAKMRNALDCFCTGTNWCYVATHSAGDLMLGYSLANYGSSVRTKKNAVAASDGTCGNSGAGTQTGWNIKWVRVASGAGGGSELSDVGSWSSSEPLVQDLKTSTARAMYNHNATAGIMFYMYAGAKGTVYSGILPGQDDDAVAYHSTGGVSGSAGGAWCNPTDGSCNDLTMGTAANEGGRVKWTNHSVTFRDNNEAYSHSGGGNWGGIVGVVRSAMVSTAL
ncbi:MAG: hypothetical protein V4631_01355 [Pseudomonadota bacterium]